MTAALCVVECAWCHEFVSASIVESATEGEIVSHGACDSCLLAEFMRQDAAEAVSA